MSEKFFNGEQIRTILVEVGAEGVPEGMTGQAVFPAELFLMGMDVAGKVESVDWPVRIALLGKNPLHKRSLRMLAYLQRLRLFPYRHAFVPQDIHKSSRFVCLL